MNSRRTGSGGDESRGNVKGQQENKFDSVFDAAAEKSEDGSPTDFH